MKTLLFALLFALSSLAMAHTTGASFGVSIVIRHQITYPVGAQVSPYTGPLLAEHKNAQGTEVTGIHKPDCARFLTSVAPEFTDIRLANGPGSRSLFSRGHLNFRHAVLACQRYGAQARFDLIRY